MSPTPEAAARFDAVRGRADAAFAKAGDPDHRFETRIGPQPWPGDLPSGWPMTDADRVVADSRRRGGERLLWVDVSGAPDRALDRYQRALRAEGYAVAYDLAEASTDPSRPVLRATRGAERAVLTFFGRDRSTRIEILLSSAPRG